MGHRRRQRHDQIRPRALCIGNPHPHLRRQRLRMLPFVQPRCRLAVLARSAIGELDAAQAVGQRFRRTRAAAFDGLAGQHHAEVDLQGEAVAVARHAQRMQVRTTAAEVIRQVGDEAHRFRFTGEAPRLAGLRVEFEHQALHPADPPAQEFGHRADPLVAFRDRLAALRGGARRAHGGEAQCEPGGEQHGRQQHIDQGESRRTTARADHGPPTPSGCGSTSRNDDSRTRCAASPSPHATCSCRCSRRAAFGSMRTGPLRGAGSVHGSTSSRQR